MVCMCNPKYEPLQLDKMHMGMWTFGKLKHLCLTCLRLALIRWSC